MTTLSVLERKNTNIQGANSSNKIAGIDKVFKEARYSAMIVLLIGLLF